VRGSALQLRSTLQTNLWTSWPWQLLVPVKLLSLSKLRVNFSIEELWSASLLSHQLII
jgi:hypothetical protein